MARDDERFAFTEGDTLDEASAAALEESLISQPENIPSRLKLLGYYFNGADSDPAIQERRADHVIWFILNAPTRKILGSPVAAFDESDPEATVARIRAAWAKHFERLDPDPQTILNAADLLDLVWPNECRELLERGEALRPDWPIWASRLGSLTIRPVIVALRILATGKAPLKPLLDESARRREARSALEHFERALQICDGEAERFPHLSDAAEAALVCGEREKAKEYSAEILRLAPSNDSNRHRLDYVHLAHIILGRLALEAGDVAAAKGKLLLAGKTGSPDAPVLRSFGPDFSLAQLLLERGETGVVFAYFHECKRFWKERRIEIWLTQIGRGETPRLHTGYDPDLE